VTEPDSHASHVSIGHPGRTPERLIILGLVLLLLLLTKPWGTPPQQAGSLPQPTAPSPVGSVPATPAPRGSAGLPCTGLMWLVEADTRWAGQPIRSWILTDAVEATGPTDPRISFVVVAAQEVRAIGYCPPHAEENRLNDRLTIYRIDPTISTISTATVPVRGDGETGANELFAPITTPGPSGEAPGFGMWAPGRYVLRIDGPGHERWLGVEVRLVAAGQASAGPSPAGAPRP
jgi:hypothetical protein